MKFKFLYLVSISSISFNNNFRILKDNFPDKNLIRLTSLTICWSHKIPFTAGGNAPISCWSSLTWKSCRNKIPTRYKTSNTLFKVYLKKLLLQLFQIKTFLMRNTYSTKDKAITLIINKSNFCPGWIRK